MSQLQVNRINDASGGVLAPISSVMRNRIINGAMVIDQRNAGASVTPTNGQYGIDRWVYGLTQASKFTAQQSSDAPAGFSFSNLITSSSAFSIGSSDEFEVFQRIEGFNTADLGFGTANAKTVTLSFWVKSSLTGTFGGSLSNSATNRSYVFSYSISAANTWEQKSVTIAGDTTGTWVGATNGTGLVVLFSLGAGSSRVAAAGAWNGAFNVGVTGQTNLVSTNGATWRITGCQLEVGTQATSFEYRQYGTELALCQRYFVALKYSSGAYLGVAQAILTTAVRGPRIYFPVELRANPTITLPPVSTTNGVSHLASGDQYPTIGSATLNPSSISQLSFSINGDTYGASFTAGNASNLYASGNQVVTASSEL